MKDVGANTRAAEGCSGFLISKGAVDLATLLLQMFLFFVFLICLGWCFDVVFSETDRSSPEGGKKGFWNKVKTEYYKELRQRTPNQKANLYSLDEARNKRRERKGA